MTLEEIAHWLMPSYENICIPRICWRGESSLKTHFSYHMSCRDHTATLETRGQEGNAQRREGCEQFPVCAQR